MKQTVIILLTLLISLSTKAQKVFKEASILFNNGTTEKAMVQFSSTVDPSILIYKKKGDLSEIKIFPYQIKSCNFTEINREILSEKIDGKNQFLETIVKGKSNFLLYISETGLKRYFLKSQKSGLKELTIEEKFRDTRKFTYKKFIGVLNIDFNDCSDISSKINRTSLQISSLAKVFMQYNECINGTGFESERLNRKSYHKIEIEAGINNTQIKSAGTSDPSNFENKTTPYLGINYVYTPTFFSSQISLFTGLSYFEISSQRILENQAVSQPNKIEVEAVNFQLGFIYNLRNIDKKLKPNIGIYTLLMYPISNVQSVYRKTNDSGEDFAVYSDNELKNYGGALGFQLGCNYQIFEGNEIFIKINYQRTGDFLLDFEQSYPFDSFIIKAGYSINL